MRAPLADFCVRWAWVACAMCVACTPAERGPFAGASDSWKNAAAPVAASAAPPPAVWDSYAQAQTWPLANSTPFASRGHEPEAQVDVRVNDVARPSYLGLVTDTVFPDGSVLFEQARASAAGRFSYAMGKVGAEWTFARLDAQGRVLESGALELCAGCHAQARADHVFGLPHEP